jgi:glycosyltransferase involved in cell wall biosynthesis
LLYYIGMTKRQRLIIDGEVLVMPHFSGIGHYTLELLRALDKILDSKNTLDVSLIVHFRHVKKAESFGFKNIAIIPSPFSLRISNGLKLRNKQPPLDLLFGKGVYLFPNFTSWPLAFSKSVPIIYDLSYEKYAEFAEPRNQAFLSAQVKKSAQRASHIITISQNSKNEICDFYQIPQEKISIAYPAVDTSHFYPRTKEEVSKVLKKYKLSGQYILFVGNIEPRKNLINLLLAYEKLPDSLRKKYSLVLVGAKGWQDEKIFETIKRLQERGDIIQLPSSRVSDVDMPAVYSGASVFVYPSIYEGFGIPPIEAMACKAPVVASNNSSLPEACGDAALLVNAESIKEMSNGIKSLLSDKDMKLKYTSLGAHQVKKFSWDKSAKILLDTVVRAV